MAKLHVNLPNHGLHLQHDTESGQEPPYNNVWRVYEGRKFLCDAMVCKCKICDTSKWCMTYWVDINRNPRSHRSRGSVALRQRAVCERCWIRIIEAEFGQRVPTHCVLCGIVDTPLKRIISSPVFLCPAHELILGKIVELNYADQLDGFHFINLADMADMADRNAP